MSNLKTVSKLLFNNAPITTINHSLKSVKDTPFLYAETKPKKGVNHFFGLNIEKLRRSKFVVLVLGNDSVCLKIPSEVLLKLPLYKTSSRFLVNIEFNADTQEYQLFYKKSSSKQTSINCSQFQHTLLTDEQISTLSVGLRSILL